MAKNNKVAGASTPKKAPGKHPGSENLMPPWKPGQSGNPAGRKPSSRNQFSEEYICAVHTVWREGGIDALRRLCEEDPAAFVHAAGKLVPKEFGVNVGEDTQNSFYKVWEYIGKMGREADMARANEDNGEGE